MSRFFKDSSSGDESSSDDGAEPENFPERLGGLLNAYSTTRDEILQLFTSSWNALEPPEMIEALTLLAGYKDSIDINSVAEIISTGEEKGVEKLATGIDNFISAGEDPSNTKLPLIVQILSIIAMCDDKYIGEIITKSSRLEDLPVSAFKFLFQEEQTLSDWSKTPEGEDDPDSVGVRVRRRVDGIEKEENGAKAFYFKPSTSGDVAVARFEIEKVLYHLFQKTVDNLKELNPDKYSQLQNIFPMTYPACLRESDTLYHGSYVVSIPDPFEPGSLISAEALLAALVICLVEMTDLKPPNLRSRDGALKIIDAEEILGDRHEGNPVVHMGILSETQINSILSEGDREIMSQCLDAIGQSIKTLPKQRSLSPEPKSPILPSKRQNEGDSDNGLFKRYENNFFPTLGDFSEDESEEDDSGSDPFQCEKLSKNINNLKKILMESSSDPTLFDVIKKFSPLWGQQYTLFGKIELELKKLGGLEGAANRVQEDNATEARHPLYPFLRNLQENIDSKLPLAPQFSGSVSKCFTTNVLEARLTDLQSLNPIKPAAPATIKTALIICPTTCARKASSPTGVDELTLTAPTTG